MTKRFFSMVLLVQLGVSGSVLALEPVTILLGSTGLAVAGATMNAAGTYYVHKERSDLIDSGATGDVADSVEKSLMASTAMQGIGAILLGSAAGLGFLSIKYPAYGAQIPPVLAGVGLLSAIGGLASSSHAFKKERDNSASSSNMDKGWGFSLAAVIPDIPAVIGYAYLMYLYRSTLAVMPTAPDAPSGGTIPVTLEGKGGSAQIYVKPNLGGNVDGSTTIPVTLSSTR